MRRAGAGGTRATLGRRTRLIPAPIPIPIPMAVAKFILEVGGADAGTHAGSAMFAAAEPVVARMMRGSYTGAFCVGERAVPMATAAVAEE